MFVTGSQIRTNTNLNLGDIVECKATRLSGEIVTMRGEQAILISEFNSGHTRIVQARNCVFIESNLDKIARRAAEASSAWAA